MAKVDIKINCNDLGLFQDPTCDYPFHMTKLERDDNTEAYNQFKVLARSHFKIHEGKTPIKDLDALNKELESGFSEFKSKMNSKAEITREY